MKIAVIGASGWLGGTFTREALGRGHEVTAIGRDPDKLAAIDGTTAVVADINDPDGLVQALAGHDVVVSAVTDRSPGRR
jgi:putative NADH-flavin reductase